MLVRDAIKEGFREANLTLAGRTPTDAESTEALSRLNDFRLWLFRKAFGESLVGWPVPPPTGLSSPPESLVSPNLGTDWYLFPVSNVRLQTRLTAATTIRLPADPAPGARFAVLDVGSSAVDLTLSGNGKLIEGQQSIIGVVETFNGAEWFYRDDLSSWERMDPLTLDSNLPLPEEYNDLFILYTAVRMGPRNNHKISDDTRGMLNALIKDAKAHYQQSQSVSVVDKRAMESLSSFGTTGDRSWMG